MLYSERGNSGKFENWKDFLSLFFKVALTLITLWVEAKAFFKIFSFCFIGNTNLQTNRQTCCGAVVNCDGICDMREVTAENFSSILLPILTNRWSALASIGLYRKPQKQRGSMGTECCFCCIFLNAKPMMNWHLPQLQRNYFWAKSCRAFVQLWHWILVTSYYWLWVRMFNCNGEELGHLNLVFMKS